MCRADRWIESGGPETAPASALKCVVPLMSLEGCFHAATKVVSPIQSPMREGEGRLLAVSARSLSTCRRRDVSRRPNYHYTTR